ncbi:MAG: response regulator transcription factor [Ilumatobacteraceae bacterium]|nr:response regulator transcription factor [Ilumatobacteraceae bacterium]
MALVEQTRTSAGWPTNPATTTGTIRVMIVDGHPMVGEGLGAALGVNADIDVVAVAATLSQAIDLLAEAAAEVVVLDASLGDLDTPAAVAAMLARSSSVQIIVLGADAEYTAVLAALEAGASGYLLKAQQLSELAEAVRTVRGGGRALAGQLVNTLVDRLSSASNRRYHLTARELDVLGRLAEGASTAAVAQELDLSVNTVRNHVQSAIRRLRAHSKLEAISIARREGLIGSVPPRR